MTKTLKRIVPLLLLSAAFSCNPSKQLQRREDAAVTTFYAQLPARARLVAIVRALYPCTFDTIPTDSVQVSTHDEPFIFSASGGLYWSDSVLNARTKDSARGLTFYVYPTIDTTVHGIHIKVGREGLTVTGSVKTITKTVNHYVNNTDAIKALETEIDSLTAQKIRAHTSYDQAVGERTRVERRASAHLWLFIIACVVASISLFYNLKTIPNALLRLFKK